VYLARPFRGLAAAQQTVNPAPFLSLADLPTGSQAVLRRIHSAEARMALLNMGVMPGDVLELTDRILGGCPIAFRVRSTKIALRRRHAESVEVELVAPVR
jgi:Fe2+ transport system protein FeoA